jgi:hypothetical protein
MMTHIGLILSHFSVADKHSADGAAITLRYLKVSVNENPWDCQAADAP